MVGRIEKAEGREFAHGVTRGVQARDRNDRPSCEKVGPVGDDRAPAGYITDGRSCLFWEHTFNDGDSCKIDDRLNVYGWAQAG